MAALAEVAFQSRRIIKYGTLFVLFLLSLRLVWVVGLAVYRRFVPPPPPAPTVSFGKLAALPFPKPENTPAYIFTLEAPTGALPQLPSQAKVYFMPETQASFLDLENAQRTAQALGFTKSPQTLTETVYRFEHNSEPASIDMNIINKTFSLNYNLAASPQLLNLRPRSTQEALASINAFLSQGGLLPTDLAAGTPTFEFRKVEPPNLVPASSLSEASFIRVNLFRQTYDELPVLTQNKNRANVWFLVSGDSTPGRQIIAGEYHYFPVESEHFATYPIKSAQEAWDEFQGGHGFVTSPSSLGETKITIRRVFLAYMDLGKPQKFLQPVVVFEGDNDFQAVVPAVTREYYSQE